MKLVKKNKFYIVILDGTIEIEKQQKNKQKFWNNKKWKMRHLKK